MEGIILCMGGQLLRSLAMLHAGKNFNHQVELSGRADHVLVTTGIYKFVRHPSYTGFLCWVVGLQLSLGNTIMTVLSTVVVWRFFKERIPPEEAALLRMFKDGYLEYRTRTWSGIPFIT